MDGASSSSGGESLRKVASEDDKAGIGMAAAVPEKLKVVRVKRKREQSPIENLWLEVSDPPTKRHEPDIGSLSLSSESASLPATTGTGASAAAKVLFRRLETLSPAGKAEASLVESLVQRVSERKHAYEKRRDQQESRAKEKAQEKQEHLLAAAKDRHEVLARRARFEQVWKSRRDVVATVSGEHAESDPMRELFHLYDLVRVDEESPEVVGKREKAKREAELAQAAILRNYLPLLRDCLPEAAADLEQDLTSRNAPVETDDYVYDVYAMDEGFSDHEGNEEEFYPTVQIIETEGFDWREPVDSEYDSEDSNDENNPLNDYPDEDDFGDFGDEKSSNDSDDSGDSHPYGSDDEEYDTVAYDNEEELRWSRRQ